MNLKLILTTSFSIITAFALSQGTVKISTKTEIWNKTINSWRNSVMVYHTLDSKGFPLVDTVYTQRILNQIVHHKTNSNGNITESVRTELNRNTDQWENKYRESFVYDAQFNKTRWKLDFWDGSEWLNDRKIEYTLNSADLLTTETFYKWNTSSSSWEDQTITTYTYNSNDLEIERLVQDKIQFPRFTNSLRVYTIYNIDNNVDSVKSYSWFNNMWTFSSIEKNHYNQEGFLSISENQQWDPDDSTWEKSTKDEFEYDGSGNLTTHIRQDWSPFGRFENDTKYTYSYANVTALDEQDKITETAFLFPNPAKNEIKLVGVKSAHITICNSMGQVVSTEISNSNEYTLNVIDLQTGIYHVVIKNKDYQQVIPFVLSK